MDIRERFEDTQEMLRTAIHGALTGVWTALPGIVQSFDAQQLTVTVQPAIQGLVRRLDRATATVKTEAVDLPLLGDVPVVFARGGGCTLTFPIQKGDECVVVFASRCIDGWWQSGGVQRPMEPRRHDLSDGFALIGPFSQKTKIKGIHPQAVQLRSDDGATYIELDPTTQKVKIAAPGGLEIDAPQMDVLGQACVHALLTYLAGMSGRGGEEATAAITGNLTIHNGQVSVNGKRVDDTHTHSGVEPGGGTSGPVV